MVTSVPRCGWGKGCTIACGWWCGTLGGYWINTKGAHEGCVVTIEFDGTGLIFPQQPFGVAGHPVPYFGKLGGLAVIKINNGHIDMRGDVIQQSAVILMVIPHFAAVHGRADHMHQGFMPSRAPGVAKGHDLIQRLVAYDHAQIRFAPCHTAGNLIINCHNSLPLLIHHIFDVFVFIDDQLSAIYMPFCNKEISIYIKDK